MEASKNASKKHAFCPEKAKFWHKMTAFSHTFRSHLTPCRATFINLGKPAASLSAYRPTPAA
jgi:hypothetical protein